MSLSQEIDENYRQFQSSWWADVGAAWEKNTEDARFANAYTLIASVNGIRSNLAKSDGDKEFLLEAQNDGLASIVQCQMGMFRASLQSLRSYIESTLNGLYFKDHPIELERWRAGKFRTSFTDLSKYYAAHPALADLPQSLDATAVLIGEYGVLSKAVHGSAKAMWMSGNGAVNLAGVDAAKIGAWNARFAKTVKASLILMISLYRRSLTGSQFLPLRTTIGLSLAPRHRTALREALGITFPQA